MYHSNAAETVPYTLPPGWNAVLPKQHSIYYYDDPENSYSTWYSSGVAAARNSKTTVRRSNDESVPLGPVSPREAPIAVAGAVPPGPTTAGTLAGTLAGTHAQTAYSTTIAHAAALAQEETRAALAAEDRSKGKGKIYDPPPGGK